MSVIVSGSVAAGRVRCGAGLGGTVAGTARTTDGMSDGRAAPRDQGARDVKEPRGGEQEEVGAGRESAVAGEHPQVKKGEAPQRDQPADALTPPGDREPRDHPDREEQ